ncbi:hypothetical protein KAFR_0G02110 [Kazachstania africana CBS 2517]|uniref:Uncharacterized protein n=1 Tax=Kazachstania africana (strain ATCC 22294 / BCRC 22015 / CBS 2517 / CECT 1963 / NBRC 1671 / NRRL Y-8276) TaxID=1071382 RepID=H2AXZ5_KAZAF|nr:hypothetical protein KAFR_0G02110 [Kazachstania africana CBS 2517]CCF59245.1 hypothetical protein KAFR_0G02110 [Kazachstania africana CBS 2517]
MVTSITRKLLRDWKFLMRHNNDMMQDNKTFFYLSPQDSNLHIWHVVLIDPTTKSEVYILLYFTDPSNENVMQNSPGDNISSSHNIVILMRCLTPSSVFPINKNISLNHLSSYLLSKGFRPFLMELWHIFFDNSHNISIENARLLHAWNRIMYKDFKLHFPFLMGNLRQGDYQMVKNLSKNLSNNVDLNIFLHQNANSIVTPCENNIQHHSTNIHAETNSHPSTKRQRLDLFKFISNKHDPNDNTSLPRKLR